VTAARIIAPPPPPPPRTNGAPPAPVANLDPADLFTDGEESKGYFVVIAGPPKYGKTTFALGAPNPVFILTDRGGLKSAPRTVKRTMPETWDQVLAAFYALRDKPHTHGAVVLDTVFKAETMLIKHLCVKDGKDSLRKVGGGYKTPYEWMASEINKIVDVMFTLNARGIHTIVISQTEHQSVKDASADDYEKTALAMTKQTALIWSAAADVNMYVQPEMKERDRIEGGKDKEDRIKVDFTGKAICHVRPAAGIEAGNRLFLDSPMTYSWAALEIGAREGSELRDRLFTKLATLDTTERAAADWRLNQAGWSREAAMAEITK
jgi:sporulation protein YlmC with PRC-barrel domain